MSLAKYLARGGEEMAPLLAKLKGAGKDFLHGREFHGPGEAIEGMTHRAMPRAGGAVDFLEEHPELLAGGAGAAAGYELGSPADEDEDSHLKAVMKKLGL